MLISEGLRSDVVDAALSVNFDDPLIAKEKVRALDLWRTSEDYRPLVTALKRAGNIVPKGFAGVVKRRTAEAGRGKRRSTPRMCGSRTGSPEKTAALDFRGALADIASLRKPVDAFFDKVMVMDKDAAVKENRLALLAGITGLFSQDRGFLAPGPELGRERHNQIP